MSESLKAPFPYFGGKRSVAGLVWARLGNPDNYIEPFFGSGAVLLLRPRPLRGVETANDADCYLANFWRATQHDPEAVAAWADGPVNECDLRARHRWLVLSDDAVVFRERMQSDPCHYDARIAGWWCWGLCCWIGSGWCRGGGTESRQKLPRGHSESGSGHGGSLPGVHKKLPSKVRISGDNPGSCGKGVHAGGSAEWRQAPYVDRGGGRGVNSSGKTGGRPQLADAYDIGRGVHSQGELNTCEARRAWMLDWFSRLRDRLRNVRVCCGDWSRVCSSESVTTRLGVTGVLLDPPYSREAGRTMGLYAQDCGAVAHDVRRWCLERGSNPMMRIALCGYASEGHEDLERAGWSAVAWQASGYGNRSERGRKNAGKERIWFSPHCLGERDLFRDAGDVSQETPDLFASQETP